ncbi:MAG TPA: BMP family ABC transporter substrate-binding protein, partial [Faecalibacterium sp.]|nr:BMP family ABC transporter substrate-binding protein [Faecalibacterium sp.]
DIGTDEIPSNCYCITFKEEQAGYLAGYAIAKDGKTKLGFLGGMAVPAVIRYGYGFVQGADAAAQELGQNIDINYF